MVSSVFVYVQQAAFLFIRQRIQQILRRLEVLVEDGGDAVAVHAGLFDVKVRRFMRREFDESKGAVFHALLTSMGLGYGQWRQLFPQQ